MKLYHYGVLFIAMFFCIVIILDIKTSSIKVVLSERKTIDQAITKAVDAGTSYLLQASINDSDLIMTKDTAVEKFFTSLYASFDILDKPASQKKLRYYIPTILVTDMDGFYVLYCDEYTNQNGTYIEYRWSEKYPYVYEDEYFFYNFTLTDKVWICRRGLKPFAVNNAQIYECDYHEIKDLLYANNEANLPDKYFAYETDSYYQVRNISIMNIISEKLSYYLNEYNIIAKQYGIEYKFSLPQIDQSEIIRALENPAMIVIFQGYPLNSLGYMYNRTVIGGAQISQKEYYYIEEKDWYKIYHKSDCIECTDNMNIDQDRIFYSVEDCAREGAFACPLCCPNGIFVSEFYEDYIGF